MMLLQLSLLINLRHILSFFLSLIIKRIASVTAFVTDTFLLLIIIRRLL